MDSLNQDGHLVILKDQLPSVGELPHANGYVILNESALQHLFDSGNDRASPGFDHAHR